MASQLPIGKTQFLTSEVYQDQLWIVSTQRVQNRLWNSVKSVEGGEQSLVTEDGWEMHDNIDKDQIGIVPKTRVQPKLINFGGFLYLFWFEQSNDELLVSRYGPDFTSEEARVGWSPYSNITTEINWVSWKVKNEDGLGFDVVVSGDHLVISIVYSDSIHYLILKDDFDYTKREWETSIGKVFLKKDIPFPKDYSALEFEFEFQTSLVIHTSGPKSDDTKPAVEHDPFISILQSITTIDSDKNKTNWNIESNITASTVPDSLTISKWDTDDESNPVFFRDPAGRITCLSVGTKSETIYRRRISTKTPTLVWGERTDTTWPATGVISAFYAPDGVPQKVEKTDPNSGETFEVTDLAMIERIVWRDDRKNIFLNQNSYGTLRKHPSIESLPLSVESNGTKSIIGGYIEGPPPIPAENVLLNPDGASGNFTYGDTTELENTDTLETSIAIGYKSEGSGAPAVGAGPVWDISLSLGAGFEKTTSETFTVTETASNKLELRDGIIQPYGIILLTDIILTRDAFMFIDEGETEAAEDAPLVSFVHLSVLPTIPQTYEIPTVTPGDLESYTKEAWDERMKDQYPDKDSYIDDVVKPNQLDFVKDLVYGWAAGGSTSGGFDSTNSEFKSNSITLDASIFTGVGAKFLGAEANLLSGVEFSVSATETSKNESQFGLSTELECPAPALNQPGVIGYSYQVFFLPGNISNWLDELRYFLGKQEKPNPLYDKIPDEGTCWKVMSVVTKIDYNDDISILSKHGLSDQEIEALHKLNIKTTSQAIHSLGYWDLSHFRRSIDSDSSNHKNKSLFMALCSWDNARNIK